MTYPKSKQFVKRNLFQESSLNTNLSDFQRDDDDPLSIRSSLILFLGIFIACLTILIPSISVFLGRPLSQVSEIIINHSIKKDGSKPNTSISNEGHR